MAGVVLPLLALLLAQQAPPASGEAIVGIDLGTTYSCVTIVRNGEVEVVPNDLGERTTPSWVAYSDTGRLVGQAAKNQVRAWARWRRRVTFPTVRLAGCTPARPPSSRSVVLRPRPPLQVDMNPENTIYDSKRLIGQDFKSIKKDLKFYSFTVLNKGGKPFVQVGPLTVPRGWSRRASAASEPRPCVPSPAADAGLRSAPPRDARSCSRGRRCGSLRKR